MSVDCPYCGLTNPTDAQRCDCGYDFTKEHDVGSLPEQRPPQSLRAAVLPDLREVSNILIQISILTRIFALGLTVVVGMIPFAISGKFRLGIPLGLAILTILLGLVALFPTNNWSRIGWAVAGIISGVICWGTLLS